MITTSQAVAAVAASVLIWLLWKARRGPAAGRRTTRDWRWLEAVYRKPASALRLDTSLRLTPQHSVHSIECGGRRWLVSCHPGGLSVVAEFGVPLGEPAPAARAAAGGASCSGD